MKKIIYSIFIFISLFFSFNIQGFCANLADFGEQALAQFPDKVHPYVVFYLRESGDIHIYGFTILSITTSGNRFTWYSATGNGYAFRTYIYPTGDYYNSVPYSDLTVQNYVYDGSSWVVQNVSNYPSHRGGSSTGYHIVIGGNFVLEPPKVHNDNIGTSLGISLFKSDITGLDDLTDVYQRWEVVWKSSIDNGQYDYDKVHVVIKGDTVIEFDSDDINGFYWFTPRDLFVDTSLSSLPITISVTPYSNGNWGNTQTITSNYHMSLLTNITKPFVDYVRSFNGGAVVGVDDYPVVTTVEKPDNSGTMPDTVTTVSTVTYYSPVFKTTNETYATNYVDNSQTVTTNEYTTINNITNTTTFTFNVNISSEDKDTNTGRINRAKQFLEEGPDQILSYLSILDGSPFAIIFTTIVGGFAILVGVAIVTVILKVVGAIL